MSKVSVFLYSWAIAIGGGARSDVRGKPGAALRARGGFRGSEHGPLLPDAGLIHVVIGRGQVALVGAVGVVAPAHTLGDDIGSVVGHLAHPAPELASGADIRQAGVYREPVSGAAVHVLFRGARHGRSECGAHEQAAGGGKEVAAGFYGHGFLLYGDSDHTRERVLQVWRNTGMAKIDG